jgi:hypothetical protein
MRSFWSSVIGSMLSASIIHFCRRISDTDILLNFLLKIIFCASNCRPGAVFFIAAGKRTAHEILDKTNKLRPLPP